MALKTKEEYVDSLRKMNKRIFMFGDEISNFVEHPIIRPSLNAMGLRISSALVGKIRAIL